MTTVTQAPEKTTSLVAKFATRYSVEPAKMLTTLKATAFKQREGQDITNEQMMALMIVADQYSLNPFTREIFAFPDKNAGIVPVVGVDGWSRIINDHPQSDGFEFRQAEKTATPVSGQSCPEWMEVIIYRKDREHPIVVREYLDEVYRKPFKEGMSGPWQTHTKRMLRHKTLIQGARLAYGFTGIYDEDEAERIIERDVTAEGEVIHTTKTNAVKDALRKRTQDAAQETNVPPTSVYQDAMNMITRATNCKDHETAKALLDEAKDFCRELTNDKLKEVKAAIAEVESKLGNL